MNVWRRGRPPPWITWRRRVRSAWPLILVELADERDAEVKRRLRLELAAQSGSDTIAAEIGKRITALRSARSFVDWQKRRDFVKDLDLQRTMIVDRVAQTAPTWRST